MAQLPAWSARLVLNTSLSLAALGAMLLAGPSTADLGGQPSASTRVEQWERRSRELDARTDADPFVGVTADGTPQAGLFTLTSTGVSTEPVKRAADAFLTTLTDAQRTKTQFAVDAPEWRHWANQHFYRRAGVSFDEMTPAQRDAAFGLLKASLSARGLTLSRDIMRLNHTLAELNANDFESYGEWLYHLTVMGTPSTTTPWGWQIDGHHLVINYVVIGDQVVMTPSFFGSEPVVASAGKYAGTWILQEEQAAGLALINALDPAQRARAILRSEKTTNDNKGEAGNDNVLVPTAGLPVRALTPTQQATLLDLVALHIGKMDDGHARVKMDEVRAHLDATYLAWVGGTAPDSVFYYRIHSPVVLIEFDHQLPVAMRHLVPNPKVPFRDHIPVVVRTPNGTDYGKDLLRQHYAQHRADASHGHQGPAPGLALTPLPIDR